MRKVKLSVDALSVESFEIPAETEVRSGTVKANEAPTGQFTCKQSCQWTCETIACPCIASEYYTQCVC